MTESPVWHNVTAPRSMYHFRDKVASVLQLLTSSHAIHSKMHCIRGSVGKVFRLLILLIDASMTHEVYFDGALYCVWPETALLAKCEDRVCQGTVAEKSAILTDVEYGLLGHW